MNFEYVLIFLISFAVAFTVVKLLIPRLKKEGMVGKDENKPGFPEIPEMGGIGVIAGFTSGMLLAIFLVTFTNIPLNLIDLLAVVITTYSIAFIGMIDDFFGMPQKIKAILPIFAAIPLVAVKFAVRSVVNIPFFGPIDFGIAYLLILVPLGITVCSNLTNMLAGFNGMEAGMGIVMFLTIFVIGAVNGSYTMAVIALSMLGALCAFFIFNAYPAKVFPGDVAALSIGVVLASSVIIGSYESAGAILMIPFVVDFIIKLRNGLPHTKQDFKNGKLYPRDGKVQGLVHVVMNAFNGITEKNLALVFIGMEAVLGVIVISLYVKPI